MARTHRIRELIERIARINAADEWTTGLNPTQWAALSYLSDANRFSRSPSQVAEFMAATRGTVSQTLKALARKELIEEVRSETDRRWISYNVSKKGQRALKRLTVMDEAVDAVEPEAAELLVKALEGLLRAALEARGKKPFGECKTCRHYQPGQAGGYCTLLKETLTRAESRQICHEHRHAA